MQKTAIFALLAVLVASVVGGAIPASASTSVAYPGTLVCTPSVQYVSSGQWVSFSAQYQYPYDQYTTPFTWSAPSGSPSSGIGASFTTRFWTTNTSQTTFWVYVTDGSQTATCTVYVSGSGTPTPTPQAVGITPTNSTINSGNAIAFTAWGGDGAYSWSAPNGNPSSGWGTSFTTTFFNHGTSVLLQEVRVTSDNTTASAWITVLPEINPSPWFGNVQIEHTVRNVTRGSSEASWVSAYNGDRLQFTVRITTGNQYAQDVYVRDWLPQYLQYVAGSTTLDGSWRQDGITTSSLALGTLAPNRTYVLRFEVTVSGAPNTTLTNSINVHVYGYTDQNRTSTIAVYGSSITPTPTPDGNEALSLGITGRNVTRGQSGEHASLSARGDDTLDLIIRVRSQEAQYRYNVIVTDSLPVGVIYVPGSTTLNGRSTSDGITSSGLNIGTLASWEEAIVKFSVRVDAAYVPTSGRTTVTNTAQARADGTDTISTSISLTLGTEQALAAASGIKTGLTDTLPLALALALAVTGVYAIYTRTGTFNRRMALAELKSLARKPLNFIR